MHRLSEKHGLGEIVFLVGGFGYQTALARLGLSGRYERQKTFTTSFVANLVWNYLGESVGREVLSK